jgi:GTPase-activating protein SST2
MQNLDVFDPTDNDVPLVSPAPAAPPGLSPNQVEEVGGAYMTVSQQASEREHRQVIQKPKPL